MQSLIIFLIIFCILTTVTKGKNAGNGKTKTSTPKQVQQRPNTAPKPAAAVKKAQNRPEPEETEGESGRDAAVRPLQPTVHVSEHTHGTDGSMAFTSAEGEDPCHEEELRKQEMPCDAPKERPEEETASGLQLQWTGDEMVRAFVMSEVLTRPGDRRR